MLNKELLKLKENGLYPFHMPGHKRNIELGSYEDNDFGRTLSAMYDMDITEIDGFDNLHDAKELIRESEDRAARLYKSSETHFLVNGATGGILSAISAVTNRGDKIIVARNCHIAVYNAIEIRELKPVFIFPEIVAENEIRNGICGCIQVSDIEKAVINNPDAKAVVITSPTYDGIISDIAAISRIAHEYDIPLIVDEAHGALFFMEGRSAVLNGADIVINSVHKTLPALTQTALIHVNGKIVNRTAVRKYLSIFQTSSPSYILMGSIDYAVSIMEEKGNRLYRDYCIRTVKMKQALSKLRHLTYLQSDNLIKSGVFDFDNSKVLIASGTTGLRGKDIYNILRDEYRIQPEMAAGDYVLLMTTLFDTDEGIDRLIDALYEIDRKYSEEEIDKFRKSDDKTDRDRRYNSIPGTVSEKTVFVYPPGIPIIVKGETVSEETVSEIEKALKAGLDVKMVD